MNDIAKNTTDDIDAREHVGEIVKASGTSFYWGMRILSPERRNGMFAVYAFCREVDDIADSDESEAEKLTQLTLWRGEIDCLFAGRPNYPTARALLEPVREFNLRKLDFLAVIDGMEMDAREQMRGPEMKNFELYCARVAGAVGLLSTRVFGDASPRAKDHALALGCALQTTNILRDLYEDAARGRLYLPKEMLLAHGITDIDPRMVLRHPSIGGVCADLAELAQERFSEAATALEDCDKEALRPARIMGAMYRGILTRLIKRGWERLDEPVRVPKLEKFWITLRYGLV